MPLLDLLRPGSTRGWDMLDSAAQNRLLDMAYKNGDRDTLRMLAELRNLTGGARERLLVERETSVRRRILSRSDLTDTELSDILTSERRGGVLAALAETADRRTITLLIDIATASRGAGLAEQLLAKTALDRDDNIRLTHHIISCGKNFSDLGNTAARVAAGLAGDTKVLTWVAGDPAGWQVSYLINQALRHATRASSTAADALERIDALAEAGLWHQLAKLVGLHLESSQIVSKTGGLSAGEAAGLVAALRARKNIWQSPDTFTESLDRILTDVSTVLPAEEQSGHEAAPDVTQARTCPASDIVQLLNSAELTDSLIVELAENDNHTGETAAALAHTAAGRDDVLIEILLNVDRVNENVWHSLSGRGAAISQDARTVLTRAGADRLRSILTSDRFRTVPAGRTYWRNPTPLLGSMSVLAWLLAGGSEDEELDQIALDMPASSIAGAEPAVFALLHRQVGDDERTWEALDGLADGWEGTIRELIQTAAAIR